jgi:hypothetical protein
MEAILLLMLLPGQSPTTRVQLTNMKLVAKRKKRLTKGQLLMFFGSMIMCTRFEFGDKASLGSTTDLAKYRPGQASSSGSLRLQIKAILKQWVMKRRKLRRTGQLVTIVGSEVIWIVVVIQLLLWPFELSQL